MITPEQAQLTLTMLRKLADVKLLYNNDHMFECLFCQGEPQGLSDFFKHVPDCPVLLALQLRELPRDYPDD